MAVELVPSRPDDVTAEWLTAFLAPRNPGVVVEDIQILDSTQGAATRLRVQPTYAAGHDGELPPVLFIKTALTRRAGSRSSSKTWRCDPQPFLPRCRGSLPTMSFRS